LTVEEMRVEIERVYAAAIRRAVVPGEHPAIRAGLKGPAVGITPLSWHVGISEEAEAVTPEEFREKYAEPAGQTLASEGLSYGCTQFAKLIIRDRPEVKVPSMGGRGLARKRPRVFIVHALGWGHKPDPEFIHKQAWPHAIGEDVPETSKRPKGDV
jgi:hypothetical protein